MKNKRIGLILLLMVVSGVLVLATSVMQQRQILRQRATESADVSLYLEPNSGCHNVGSTFDVVIKANAGSNRVDSYRLNGTYDSAKVQIESLTSLSNFTLLKPAVFSGGSFSIEAVNISDTLTGVVDLGKFTVKVLATGTSVGGEINLVTSIISGMKNGVASNLLIGLRDARFANYSFVAAGASCQATVTPPPSGCPDSCIDDTACRPCGLQTNGLGYTCYKGGLDQGHCVPITPTLTPTPTLLPACQNLVCTVGDSGSAQCKTACNNTNFVCRVNRTCGLPQAVCPTCPTNVSFTMKPIAGSSDRVNVRVSWTNISGAKDYLIYRCSGVGCQPKSASGTNYVAIVTTAGFFDDRGGFTDGMHLAYRVEPRNYAGSSSGTDVCQTTCVGNNTTVVVPIATVTGVRPTPTVTVMPRATATPTPSYCFNVAGLSDCIGGTNGIIISSACEACRTDHPVRCKSNTSRGDVVTCSTRLTTTLTPTPTSYFCPPNPPVPTKFICQSTARGVELSWSSVTGLDPMRDVYYLQRKAPGETRFTDLNAVPARQPWILDARATAVGDYSYTLQSQVLNTAKTAIVCQSNFSAPLVCRVGASATQPAATVTPPINCPRGNLGNLNCSLDGKIDVYDLVVMLDNYAPVGPVPVPASGRHSSDIAPATPDGLVDSADLAKLLDNWNR